MTAEEEKKFTSLRDLAMPLAKAANHEDLSDRAEQVREDILREFPDVLSKPFNGKSILQRIGKKYGYDQVYSIPGLETYFYKKVCNGIYLSILLVPGAGLDMGLVLCGPGFSYPIVNLSGHPENSAEASFFVDRMLALAAVFENMYMDAILDLYPRFPDWCPVFLED